MYYLCEGPQNSACPGSLNGVAEASNGCREPTIVENETGKFDPPLIID